ncbi:hypothetical protein [Halostagnicola sp. A-GB9-2]|uniref:hypothetical protein n=1 Tax=Halostagnicola sp. A-GB9-2 TaxID=3048066 RepID=UPI0024BF81A3|nr:hypothetical protein [Halostagnicola sp. A-GB9-2]MDJ1433131.1 hypothetical protein [Halostagnicola sp. A-GB9-2]
MSALPQWIEDRLARAPAIHPSQRRLIEVLIESDRPVLSVEQLRERTDPDATESAVRNRLEDLEELGVFGAESYADSVTVYYIDEPDSGSSDPSSACCPSTAANPLDGLSARDFFAFREPDAIRTLVLAGYQLSLVLLTAGIVLSVLGVDGVVDTGNDLGTAAVSLFALCLLIHATERIVRRRRSGR